MPVSFAEQHADLAAFLWHRREAAVRASHHDLATLSDLDDRIEAHLDGLLVAGERGWDTASAALDDEDPGTVFVAAVLALNREDHRAFAGLLDRASSAAALSRGLVSALAWVSAEMADPVISALLGARSAPLRRIGIAGCAARRRDPGSSLPRALLHQDARLRARALRSVGELGRMDMLAHVREELGSNEDACRFWAAWSGALLGVEGVGPVLSAFAAGEGALAERAADCAARGLPPSEARALIARVGVDHPRTAIRGAAALGDAALVPWVVDCMDVPALSRAAGEAFSTITGIEIERALAGEKPEGFEAGPSDDPADDRVAVDPDEKLDWPDPPAVRRAWEARRASFVAGTRYLLGKPVTPGWLGEVLRSGRQRRRAGAALELALDRRGAPLFEVRARAERQRALLGRPT